MRTSALAAASAVAGTGLAVLLGWAFESQTLKSVVPGFVPMNPATAMAFILAAVSLWLSASRPDRGRNRVFGSVLAGAVVAIACLRLLAYFGVFDAGVDQVLFRPRLEVEPIPNRMAPNTAAAFLLTGLALLGLGSKGRWSFLVTQALALVVLAASLMVLCGYAYRAGSLFQVRDFIPMALHTAAAFAVLSGGILCARPQAGLLADLTADAMGGRMARALLPGTVGIPIVLGWLRVRGQEIGLYGTEVGSALLAVIWVLVLSALVCWQARVLNRADAARRRSERQIDELNAELRRHAAELRATNRELESFSYSVSHDLRAPIRSITSFSQALLEDSADRLDEQGRDYLDRVVRAGQRMAALVDDILLLSRITRKELERDSVDLSAAASEVAQELAQEEPERQIDIRIQPGLVTSGDPQLLRVMLDNLLGNAWKFTARQPHPRIEFGALPGENGDRVFYVRDNGAGFDMEYAERLFAPFQRLHSEAEFPGTGIGLATVQRIVRRHGGKVWAEGAVDRGATFYFTF